MAGPTESPGDFDLLVASVRQTLTATAPVVVAVSGFGGSGKSTLADRLADAFAVGRRQVLRTDSLYSTTPHGAGLFDITDWPLLRRLLSDVRRSDRLTYVGRRYCGEPVEIDEPMPRVVILEGLRLFRPELMSAYDIAVWIDCPLEQATRRAKARNLAQGDSEYELGLWNTLWAPLDAEYFGRYRPKELATFVYPADF